MDEAKKQEKTRNHRRSIESFGKDIQKATDDAVKKIDSMTEKEKLPYCLINRK